MDQVLTLGGCFSGLASFGFQSPECQRSTVAFALGFEGYGKAASFNWELAIDITARWFLTLWDCWVQDSSKAETEIFTVNPCCRCQEDQIVFGWKSAKFHWWSTDFCCNELVKIHNCCFYWHWNCKTGRPCPPISHSCYFSQTNELKEHLKPLYSESSALECQ